MPQCTNAPFSGEHQNFSLHVLQSLSDSYNIGIHTLGSRSARRLLKKVRRVRNEKKQRGFQKATVNVKDKHDKGLTWLGQPAQAAAVPACWESVPGHSVLASLGTVISLKCRWQAQTLDDVETFRNPLLIASEYPRYRYLIGNFPCKSIFESADRTLLHSVLSTRPAPRARGDLIISIAFVVLLTPDKRQRHGHARR